jgi:molybdate transport system substrate-binding protein
VFVAVGLSLAACGESASSDDETLVIFAASSLTSSFEDLAERFQSANDDIRVEFNFAASSELELQLEQGATADVFASADEPNMQKAVEVGLVEGAPRILAHNTLEIIVPPDNPGGVTGLDDLDEDELVIAICNEECPAGRYALEVFDNAGLSVEPDSFETEVKGVVTRVALGEADAGIVYATDTRAAADEVEGIPIPDDVNVVATYPIAILRGASPNARSWVEFVLSSEGQDVMQHHGFLAR